MEEMVMLTVTGDPDAPPTLEAIAHLLGVPLGALDEAFGVILLDPAKRAFAVRVEAASLPDELPEGAGTEGPFSDPPISPFGPPE